MSFKPTETAVDVVARLTKPALDFADRLVEPLRRIWFTAAISLLLVFTLVIPSLASEQIREALISYAPDPRNPWNGFAWFTAIITLVAVASLSLALRFWTAKLLGIDAHNLRSSVGKRWLPFIAIWAAPWLALAASYAYAIEQLGWLWISPFGLMFGLSVAVPLIGVIALYALKADRFLDTNPIVRAFAFFALPLTFMAAVFVFTIQAPYDEVALARLFGPTAMLAFALAALTAFGSQLLLTGREWKLPVFWIAMAVPLVWGALDRNDNHPIRMATQNNPPPQLGLPTALANWSALRTAPESAPLILVSTEGGGIRAAYFTALTLARIADRCPLVANRIFAISGVSGGSVGAAVYAAAVHVRPLDPYDQSCDFNTTERGWYEERIDRVFRRDHLSPVLSRFLYADAFQRFWPWPVDEFDRQLGFEQSFREAFVESFGEDLLGGSFYALAPDSEHPTTPYLFINTTSVETGERVVASRVTPLDEEFLGTRSFYDIAEARDYSLIAMAGTSARFPYVSPSGYVGSGEFKTRFVDGGYFDNSGATTVMEIYQSLLAGRTTNPPAIPDRDAPIILMHIGNQLACDPHDETSAASLACSRPQPARGFDEYLGPLRAVLATRTSRVDYTLAQLQQVSNRAMNNGLLHEVVRIQMVDADVPIPLGWFLSTRAANEMARQLSPTRNTACSDLSGVENHCQLRLLGYRMTERM
jgi:predicted acylesterase/phospholipase RssA